MYKIIRQERYMNRDIRHIDMDVSILSFFRAALEASYTKITTLLQDQRELGYRKKSENWTIFLSNYFNDFYGLNTKVKKNAGGYKYAEMILDTKTSNEVVICHLQYLKQRAIFPRPALYRDEQRVKNPSLQQEFSDHSFFNTHINETYYLFCFGEDKEGLFGIFRQPDGQLPIYYAESKNCMHVPYVKEDTDIISEKPDMSIYTLKEDIINKLSGKRA